MKKIMITTIMLLATTCIYAQKKDVLVNTREQIVSKEDPHNPLVNGIPYNQYKTQVQAEASQRAADEAKAKIENKAYRKQNTDMKLPPKPTMVDK